MEEPEPEPEDSSQEPETEQPESTETGQEAVEEAPEVETLEIEEPEVEEPSIDELDPIKPHSDIESNDAGQIIQTELPEVLTPDDAIVVSPSGPLTTTKK